MEKQKSNVRKLKEKEDKGRTQENNEKNKKITKEGLKARER